MTFHEKRNQHLSGRLQRQENLCIKEKKFRNQKKKTFRNIGNVMMRNQSSSNVWKEKHTVNPKLNLLKHD